MTFTQLRYGNILGVVDSNGAVHSKFTGQSLETHDTYFPTIQHARWRWNFHESIHWFVCAEKPNEEQCESIRAHLTRKYGIQWWDNGHHDLDHFLARLEKERIDTSKKSE